MQKIANIHYYDPRFKLIYVSRMYIHPLSGVCTFNNKLCVFNREFDDDRVDIYLIPFMKKAKIVLKIKLAELKRKIW